MKHNLAPLMTGMILSAIVGLYAQVKDKPEFEVAVVKPNLSGGNLSTWDPDHHGNYKAENTSLKTLISSAYHIPNLMIIGPPWIDSSKYDVNAKGNPEASDTQVRLMLQRLLEDKLHVRVHVETRDMAVFLMEVASSGLKAQPLDPSKPADGSIAQPVRWTGTFMSMTGTLQDFSRPLSNLAGRPVVDRTGIQGQFHFKLWFNNNPDSDGPDLSAALSEELGLKLRTGRAPVEILVVDEAAKTPSEN